MKILRLAARILKYELRTQQWYINALAIMLATVLITLFYVYSERFHLAIQAESSHLLGGDLVLTSPHPIPTAWENEAKKLGLKVASVWTVQTVAKANHQFQFVNLQAVSEQYPLIKSKPLSILNDTILIEPRLLTLLHLKLNDRLQIGDHSFKISALLMPDVDSLSTGFNIAPRVMIKLKDLSKTHIVLPGSRVDYRLLLMGSTHQLKNYLAWIKPKLEPGQQLLDVNAQEFILKKTVLNISQIFQAVLLLTLLLCVIAILINTKEYVNHHIHFVALLRTLGAKKSTVLMILSLQIFIIGILSALGGALIAIALQYPIDYVLMTFTFRTLPESGILTLLHGILAGIALLCLTIWAPIYSLASILPKDIFQKHIILSYKAFRYTFLFNIFAIILYLFIFITFNLFTLFFLCAVILSIGTLLITIDRVIVALRYFIPYTNGTLRRGIYFVVQQAEMGGLALTTFSLIFIFVACITLMQKNLLTDFLKTWNKESPNYFIYNISQSDLPLLQSLLRENHIKSDAFYPILRGRLIKINDRPLQDYRLDWHHNALRRELNLTSSATYPNDNVIIAGKKPSTDDPLTLSIEESLAKALSVQLGDRLTFQIADQTLTGRIDNIRTVQWQSLHPNFYIIFSPHAFKNFATPYLSSIYLTPHQQNILLPLLEKFPSTTLIDISSVIKQIQQFIDHATSIIIYLFIGVIAAALLVVGSCLLATKGLRQKTNQLLKILGANKRYVKISRFYQMMIMLLIIMSISIPLTYLIYRFGIGNIL